MKAPYVQTEQTKVYPNISISANNSRFWFGNKPEVYVAWLQELMKEAVLAEDGLTYDRPSIESWFNLGKRSSPCTNKTIGIQLIPNMAVREAVKAYICQLS